MKAAIAFITCGLIIVGCARNSVHPSGTGYFTPTPPIDSKILSFKTVGIADTVTAFISGSVLGKDSIDGKTTVDTLLFATIGFISHERRDTVGTVADVHGRFQKHLKAGTYDVFVKYTGFTTLLITGVPFGSGEFKELNVLLGIQGNTYVESVIYGGN